LVAYYGIKDDAQRVDRLELVNRINENYVLIRAGIDDDGRPVVSTTLRAYSRAASTKKAVGAGDPGGS